MSWCADHGIPHSELLTWDAEDRAKLMAYLMESASRCQMCGTSAWEWEEDRFAYTPITTQCMGCYLKEAAREDDSPAGSRITLVPKAQAEKLAERSSRLPGAGE